jgi:hypothetical protein
MPEPINIQFGEEVLKANIPLSVSPTLGVAGSTGGVLVPEIIDGEIRMMVETRSPLWNILNKESWDSDVYRWREQTALPNSDFALELDVLPDRTRSVYVMRTSNLKSIYTGGEISGQMQEASKTLVNIVSREIRNAGLAMIRKLELTIINGDEGTNPEEFDGLAQWITTIVYNDTNNNGTGTDQPLTLDSLNRLMDAPPGGSPTHLIMSLPMRRRLWSILQPQVRFSGPIQDGAFTVPFYMSTPIIEIRDSHAGALDTRVYAIDNNLITVPVLLEPTYEEMAHTRDSLDFIIKMYLGLVVEGVARHHAVLSDVTSTITP